jgi:hypothetical protein
MANLIVIRTLNPPKASEDELLLKQSPSLPHQHFCNRINTIKLLSSKVEDNKNQNITAPPWSNPNIETPNLATQAFERFQKV